MKKYYKNFTFITLLFILSVSFFGLAGVRSQENNSLPKGEFKKDEVIVKFKDKQESQESIQSLGGNEQRELKDKRIYVVKVKDGESLEDLYSRLEERLDVEYVEPNYKIQTTATPNDTYFSSQWNLTKIEAPEGWDISTGDSTISIGILDTGIRYTHTDLAAKIWTNPGEVGGGKETNNIDDDGNGYIDDWRGWDFINNDNNATDDQGHGTAVAGIAAASSNNSVGVAGVDWSAKVVALKVLDSDGSGYISNLVPALEYAGDNNIDIANMSLGSYSFSQTLSDAVDEVYAEGTAMFGASGNNNLNTILYPARFSKVMAIGATDQGDTRCDVGDWGNDQYGNPQGSNWGPEMDVVAPGVSLYSTSYGGDNSYTSSFGGTSGATPHVAGLASLSKAQFSGISVSELYDLIRNSAYDLGASGFDEYYGYGRIDVNETLSPPLLMKRSDQSTVYFINETQKHVIPDGSTFGAYGFSWSDVSIVSQGVLDSYSTGAALSLVAQDSSSNKFLMNRGKKMPIDNTIYANWGIAAISVPDSFLNSKATGSNVTQVAKGDAPSVYYVENSGKRHLSGESFYGWGWDWGDVTYVTDYTMSKLNTDFKVLPPDSGFFISGSSTVYLTDWNKRWAIPNPDTMSAWGLSWSKIYTISVSDADSFYSSSGANLGIIGYGGGSYRYLLDSGERLTMGDDDYSAWGSPTVSQVDIRILSAVSHKGNLNLGLKGSSSAIYYPEGGEKRHVVGSLEFNTLNLSWDTMSYLSDYSLSLLPTGDPYYASGRFVKKADQSTIYLIDSSNKWDMPDPDTFFAFGGTWSNYLTVSNDIDTSYPTNGETITTVIKGSGSPVYYIDQAKKRHFPDSDTFLAWTGWSSVTDVSDDLLGNISTGSNMTRLAKTSSSPKIYYIKDNEKSHVGSVSAFSNCGLSWNNVSTYSSFGLRDSFLPIGEVFQCMTLEGVSLPATTGRVGREQHLSLTQCAEPSTTHYPVSGTPVAARNGMAWETSGGCGYGAWGTAPPVADERYYINMRWNYTNLHGQPIYATKSWYYRKKVVVTNPTNSKKLVASIVEYGPAPWTDRVSGLSPEGMLALGASTDDNLNYAWLADQSSASLGPLN